MVIKFHKGIVLKKLADSEQDRTMKIHILSLVHSF